MSNGSNVFDKLVKNDIRANDNILKIATVRGDDYITLGLLDYANF